MGKLNIGFGISSFNSTIRFDDHREVDVEMSTVSLSGSWLINKSFTIRAGLGVILDGSMKPKEKTKHDVEPGGIASVGLEYVVFVGEGLMPFIDLSSALSVSFTKTQDLITDRKTNYFASDLRFSARAGWNVKGKVFPYLSTRVFAGPVNWKLDDKEITGSDIHHYQLAIGTAIRINNFSLYGEWAGFGEQALSIGFSLTP